MLTVSWCGAMNKRYLPCFRVKTLYFFAVSLLLFDAVVADEGRIELRHDIRRLGDTAREGSIRFIRVSGYANVEIRKAGGEARDGAGRVWVSGFRHGSSWEDEKGDIEEVKDWVGSGINVVLRHKRPQTEGEIVADITSFTPQLHACVFMCARSRVSGETRWGWKGRWGSSAGAKVLLRRCCTEACGGIAWTYMLRVRGEKGFSAERVCIAASPSASSEFRRPMVSAHPLGHVKALQLQLLARSRFVSTASSLAAFLSRHRDDAQHSPSPSVTRAKRSTRFCIPRELCPVSVSITLAKRLRMETIRNGPLLRRPSWRNTFYDNGLFKIKALADGNTYLHFLRFNESVDYSKEFIPSA